MFILDPWTHAILKIKSVIASGEQKIVAQRSPPSVR
jgi:hypothetical protein